MSQDCSTINCNNVAAWERYICGAGRDEHPRHCDAEEHPMGLTFVPERGIRRTDENLSRAEDCSAPSR